MDNYCEIHQASSNEQSSIAEFLRNAPLVHRHLDWHTTLDWLDKSPFLVLTQEKEIKAILVAVPDPPGVAWIRCFAVGFGVPPGKTWEILAPYARSALAPMGAKMIAVSLNDWFSRVLVYHGFTVRQKIVVLEWNHKIPEPVELSSDYLVRPMLESDLDEVEGVDSASFESIWINTAASIKAAYDQAAHSYVIEKNGQIIAYEMSTASQFTAHLARLAVLPEFRRLNLGKALVSNMLTDFSHKGIIQITVNTQNDNRASLHLYKHLGFSPTFEEYPIFQEL
jgi:ribosomal protein S18 acetylase RimI-like enzyme